MLKAMTGNETSAPQNEQELEERLSRPSDGLVDSLRTLDGDLVVLGAGGKMGPTLSRMARRALDAAGRQDLAVHAVSRWSDRPARQRLAQAGVRVVKAELGLDADLRTLPDAAAVVFMVGAKFGATGNEPYTWMTNAVLPALVAQRYPGARISALSTGNIYPLVPVGSGGCREDDPPGPVGEYAMSCLGRERALEFAASARGTPVAIVRLNYAVEPRYGVLADLGRKVAGGQPVDVTTGHVNVVWQRYANDVVLRCVRHASAAPPFTVNLTGTTILSVRAVAERFGQLLDRPVEISGEEAPTALLSDATRCRDLFGAPDLDDDELMVWQAAWLRGGGPMLDKPTRFEARDGRF